MAAGVFFALLCALGWGCSYVFVRRGQAAGRVGVDAGLFLTIVANNAFNLLIVAAASATGHPVRPNAWAVLWFALGGLTTTYVGRAVVYRAVAIIGPSRADTIKVAQPLFTAALAAIFLHEALGVSVLVGMALVLGGVLALVWERLGDSAPRRAREGWRFGLGLALLGAFLYGAGNVLRKAGVDAYPSAIAGVSVSTFAALVFILAALLARGRGKELWSALLRPDRDYVLAGIANSVGLYGFFASVTFLPVAATTVIASVEPFFTVLASRVLLGRSEPLSRRLFVAAAAIVLGVAVIAVRP
jgi:drug/metabolite transporter (DMT)-like permease